MDFLVRTSWPRVIFLVFEYLVVTALTAFLVPTVYYVAFRTPTKALSVIFIVVWTVSVIWFIKMYYGRVFFKEVFFANIGGDKMMIRTALGRTHFHVRSISECRVMASSI